MPNEVEMPTYNSDNIPADFEAPGGNAWAEFQKKVPTKAIKIEGPFRVETSESENEPFRCESGWLAIDARGYPYAIADEEFELIYEPVGQPDQEQPEQPEDTPEPPPDDAVEVTEIPAGLAIGRVVIYRSKTGTYDLPAIVNCTQASIDPVGVEAGHVPELTGPSRVHLTVFTCGKQGTAREGNEVNNEAAGGSYQEFNIPQFVVEEGGTDAEPAQIVAGTWRWPERV